ncbi:hypothetical protein [Dyadobacter sp. NIV53]|uniref:hypothetical protein n=1 Tax=Dyadobacter sp. NIV53 TaxID=2861765 RepID=UPI001C87E91D|nr:hypothetical protein [Dyadobacter sp. NIV53]
MNNAIIVLGYLDKITGYSNWYKIHRKYSGDPNYVSFLEALDDTIQYLEQEKLIFTEKNAGEIDRISITDLGQKYFSRSL